MTMTLIMFMLAMLMVLCVMLQGARAPVVSVVPQISVASNSNAHTSSSDWTLANAMQDSAPWTQQCGVIMFYHIGKVGGNNFASILRTKIREFNGAADDFEFEYYSTSGDYLSYDADHALEDELVPWIEAQLPHRSRGESKILFVHQHHRGHSLSQLVRRKGVNL